MVPQPTPHEVTPIRKNLSCPSALISVTNYQVLLSPGQELLFRKIKIVFLEGYIGTYDTEKSWPGGKVAPSGPPESPWQASLSSPPKETYFGKNLYAGRRCI